MQKINHFINGVVSAPQSGQYLDNYEPATGKVYSQVASGNASDVEAAYQAACNAFEEWSTLPTKRRSDYLLQLAHGIENRLEDFAQAEAIDNGKPIALARAMDIPRAADNFRYFATAILHTHSESHRSNEEAINYTLRKPRGVAGLISPWNLPLYLFSWKIAPALATGNTVVAKPSELTPMTASMLYEIAQEIDLPPGVLNIVHGLGHNVGQAITEHPNIPCISFTGGTTTGAAVATAAAPLFKKVSLELGGKNPILIFDDADLNQVVENTVRSSFANQGQICLCGSRILVQETIYQQFIEQLAAKTRLLRHGDPLQEDTQQGALVSKDHLEKVESYLAIAKEEGANILCGGQRPQLGSSRCKDGYFLEPTILTGLAANARCNQEEIFGPVVSVIPFKDEAEAIAIANSTRYGLATSIWTQDIGRANRCAEAIDAGTVWVNCWMYRDLRVPFGGTKQSGLGREGGNEALHFFTEPKNVCIRYQPYNQKTDS